MRNINDAHWFSVEYAQLLTSISISLSTTAISILLPIISPTALLSTLSMFSTYKAFH